MADHVLDTNVLLVGSAAEHLDPRFADVHLSPDDIERVFEWLRGFRDDPERKLVLDRWFRIYEEYRHKIGDQHFGLLVVHAKMNEARVEPVEFDEHGHALVPDGLAAIDPSDKKFVAAALNDPANIHIVNACDGDWAEQRASLQAYGVEVLELLP